MSSLYVHIPFCRSRCHYCDFFSTTDRASARADYLALLLKHLDLISRSGSMDTGIQTLYVGGGTPSLLSIDHLALLMTSCNDLFGIAGEAEVTIEVNPGTCDRAYLQQLRKIGFNRLSIGLQTFDSAQLARLGRCHTREQSLELISAARSAGFDNLSIDLIFALPGQTSNDLDTEIHQLLRQQPEHISVYGLTIEAGTEFERLQHRGKLTVPDEDEYARQYELLQKRFGAAGYEHYELSNFARPGRRCRHNQRYWQRRPSRGVGCGAHSFIDNDYGERRYVPPDLERYRQRLQAGLDPDERLEIFDRQGAMKEAVYLALRTKDGIDLAAFEQRFDASFHQVFAAAVKSLNDAMITSPQRIALKPRYWLIYDHLISNFL